MIATATRDEVGRWWRGGRRGQRIRVGRQTPTFEVVGDYAYSDGDEAREVFESWGFEFYESQAYEFILYLARTADGDFAARTISVSKPRQNGKSHALRFYAIWMAVVFGAHVLFTAHHSSTTDKMYREIKNICQSVEELSDELDKSFGNGSGVYGSRGAQSVHFRNGGLIDFRTRTDSGSRGETYQIIIIDEAQELTYAQLDAINPTTLAAADVEDGGKDPQKILVGTPPAPECLGEVFRDYHDDAHDGSSAGRWWLEWSVTDVPNMDSVDTVMDAAYETNPALGYRIRESVMKAAIADYRTRPANFAREYLGWWNKARAANKAMQASAWDACYTDEPDTDGTMSIGVKFSADGSRVCISACRHYESGDAPDYIELLFDEPTAKGTTWIADWIVDRKTRIAGVIIDGKTGSGDLATKVKNRLNKKQLLNCSPKTVADAAATLVNSVNEMSVRHWSDECQASLNHSAKSSTRRRIGDGYGFDGRDSTPLESASLALLAARTATFKPGRKGLAA